MLYILKRNWPIFHPYITACQSMSLYSCHLKEPFQSPPFFSFIKIHLTNSGHIVKIANGSFLRELMLPRKKDVKGKKWSISFVYIFF